MEVLLAVAILLAVAAFVVVPLRARDGGGDGTDARRRELEARKEAKYAEIRDAELDHAAGKLSAEDFRRVDRQLRAEAIDILKEMDALDA